MLTAVVIGDALRLLYCRDEDVEFWGRCKCSWVAEVFGVHITGVRRYRKLLTELSMLSAVRCSCRGSSPREGSDPKFQAPAKACRI
ncbi:MAG: hypothetical protein H6834_03935 [Planctomycetes bacterium]|nr:hypothetical protein [Planctomycetota bacterium]